MFAFWCYLMPPALHHHVHSSRPAPLPVIRDRPKPSPSGRRCFHRSYYSSSLRISNFVSNSSSSTSAAVSSGYRPPLRYAVLGAGFAGLSVAWHLLKVPYAQVSELCQSMKQNLPWQRGPKSPQESRIRIDIYDEIGIGGGASGNSGGLLHPYSPKAKLLWRGADCWKECLELLTTAERAIEMKASNRIMEDLSNSFESFEEAIVWRRGILRPATTEKNAEILKENAQSCLKGCNLVLLDAVAAQSLVPDLCVPYNSAVYMPLAMNIHPKRYLQALFLACQNLADQGSGSYYERREINLFKEPISRLQQLSGEYDAVIICLGAKVDMLPELSGKLPLRMCRGVVTQLQLPIDEKEAYRNVSPSILSNAWLAFQGSRTVFMGSTWEWKSRNYGSSVSQEEASRAMEELLPKAAAIYPAIRNWDFVLARAGLRAMPPLTPYGSLPLLGHINDIIGKGNGCMYWLIGGLGSRGLLYHGLVGKLIAEAVLCCNENVIPSEFTSWKKS